VRSVAHSKLDASQGLSPAGIGFHQDTTTLTRKIDTDRTAAQNLRWESGSGS